MTDRVEEALRRWDMLAGTDCVAVGLSGGADSVTLLHTLYTVRDKYGFSLRAVHVHHGIRGETADRDESFCRSFCEKLGVPIDVYHFDVPSLAAEEGKGLEECGRDCRYRCFSEISKKYACRIATAHTLSDSAETLLLNLARGCGTAGLRGIPAVRGNIIRPLILCTREDIEAYCAENGLSFVTDETNFDDTYRRNRVRLDIIPELKKINPDFLHTAARLMESASFDEDYISNEAVKAISCTAVGDDSWDSAALYSLHPAIRRRAIITICSRLFDKSPDFTQVLLIEDLLRLGSGSVTLGKGMIISVSGGRIFAGTGAKVYQSAGWELPAAENVTLPDGRVLTVERVSYEEFMNREKNNKSLFKSAVSCDIIEFNALLRTRREGDRFAPAGRGVVKKVKKLLNESRIPPEDRGDLVIAQVGGSIIWIERFGAAEGYRPAPGCKCVSIITIRHEIASEG